MYANLLRTVAGILAILTTAWIIILLYNVSALGLQSPNISFSMRILFLVFAALFAAYIAIKGRLPFSAEDMKQDDEKK